MKVKGLDGKTYQMKLTGEFPGRKSSNHIRARLLFSKLYPLDQRHEEVTLPGSGKLRADFILPRLRLLAEVQGEQHFFQNSFHHQEKDGVTPEGRFAQGQVRDRRKKEWAALNGFAYVELPFDEDNDEWTERISAAVRGDADESAHA